MFRYLPLIFLLLFAGCNLSEQQTKFPVPKNDDINAIIKAVVTQDTLAKDSTPLSVDLRKIRVVVPDFNSRLPSIFSHSVSITSLIHSGNHQEGYFGKTDSLYLLFQNDTLRNFRFNKNLMSGIQLTSTNEQQPQSKRNYNARYFDMSIPIFSLDQKTAYVQLDHICPMCGAGFVLYLQKKNGEWKIIKNMMSWIN